MRPMLPSRSAFLVALVAPLAAAAMPIATPIVFLGEAAPGLPGETFSSSFGASVNDSGQVTLLAGQNLDVDLGGGDVRTIQSLVDYRASSGAQQLVATARFTDGSLGVILMTVPEPGTALLLAAGLATLAGVGSRRSR